MSALFLLAIIGVFLLPTVVGTRLIYQSLLNRLEAGDFRLSIDSVRLRWMEPLEISGIVLEEKSGPKLLSIASVRTDRGLLGYLLGGRKMGRIELIEPTVDIELMTNQSNISRLIQAIVGKLPAKTNNPPAAKPAIDIEVVVRDLSATVKRPEQTEPLVVVPPFNVNVAYRAADGQAQIHVQPTELLKEVELTEELIRFGLGYAVPLLAESAWFDGRVSASTTAIDVFLEDLPASTGQAVVTLHQVRSGPADESIIKILNFVASLRGRPTNHELVFVDGSKIEIVAKDRRIQHRGLQVGLPKVDPRLQLTSAGTVGMVDQSLDIVMQIPVPLEQLAKRESVKQLGVPMIDLPIVGTLKEPQVHWSVLREDSANLLGAIRQQIQEEAPRTASVLSGLENLAEGNADEAIATALGILQELRRKRQETADDQKSPANGNRADQLKSPPADPLPDTERKQPMRDALRNLLRKNQ